MAGFFLWVFSKRDKNHAFWKLDKSNETLMVEKL